MRNGPERHGAACWLTEEAGWGQAPLLPPFMDLELLEGTPLFQSHPWHPQKPPCRAAASSGLEAVEGPALG